MVCGEAWHTLSCSLSFLFSFPFAFPFFFSLTFIFLSSFYFSFSLAPSLTLALALVLSLFHLSSLLATKHYGKNRSTNTAANIEAFECDLAQGKCTAVGSLPPPLPSLLLPLLLKEQETFYYRNISGEGIILYYRFILIQKNQRRVKLQSLQFFNEFENNKSAPRQFCNYFCKDGIHCVAKSCQRRIDDCCVIHFLHSEFCDLQFFRHQNFLLWERQ